MMKLKVFFTDFRYCLSLNKALLTASCLYISVATPAQDAKWFIALSTGIQVSGPSASIKKSLTENGYNEASTGIFTVSYPLVRKDLPVLCLIGKQLNKKGSVYIILGMPGSAEVRGYDGRNYNNIKYHVFQFTGGYQLSFSNSRCKIGGGPSLFILQSGKNNTYVDNKLTDKHSAIKPGVSFMGRVPLGKGRKLFGLELFGELNIAPRTTFEDLSSYNDRLESYNMNMVEGLIGLSLSIGKR